MFQAIKTANEIYKSYPYLHVYGPHVLVFAIAEELSISIDKHEFRTPKFSGMLWRDPSDKSHIVVNQLHSPTRRLFTVAHELGHVFLHSSKSQGNFFCSNNIKDPKERQANAFAAELLMPEEVMLQLVSQGLTPYQMGKQLKVSEEALNWRLKHLNNKAKGHYF